MSTLTHGVSNRGKNPAKRAARLPHGSATSAYGVGIDGTLSLITPSATTHNSSACWAAVTPDDRYLYIADAASDVISGYGIGLNGSIALLNASGVAANTGAGTKPLDMAVTHNGRYLYVVETLANAIGAYRIKTDGSLSEIPGVTGLPGGFNGLVAW